jgi:CRP-like cAMP-binding protein
MGCEECLIHRHQFGPNVIGMGPFGELRALDVRSLAGPVIEADVPAGTCLVREGEPSGAFFVIRSGTADVRRTGRTLGTLGIGDCFGEIDPVTPAPQSSTVIAGSSLRVTTFSAHGIDSLCAAIPYARERIRSALH